MADQPKYFVKFLIMCNGSEEARLDRYEDAEAGIIQRLERLGDSLGTIEYEIKKIYTNHKASD